MKNTKANLHYKNLFSFKNKKVVVAGGCGLLGKEIVKCFVELDADVIVVDNNEDTLNNLLTTFDKDLHSHICDLSDNTKIPEIVGDIEKNNGNIDIWINTAYPRTIDWGNKLESVTIESWQKNIDMHLNSYCICSNEIARRMAQRNKGCIINVSSIYGMLAPDFTIYQGTDMTSPAAYSAIKGGIIAYSRYLASYYGNKGIRVNVVCPGGILTNQPEQFIVSYSKKTLLGRMAMASEIAGPVVFLASDAASYITGAVLMVDGGFSAI